MAEAYKIGYRSRDSRTQMHGVRLGQTRSEGLVLISAVTPYMTQTHQYVCLSCVDCRIIVKPYPTLRAVRTHIGKSPVCLTAGLGVKVVELQTRPTDAMVDGTGAARPSQDLRHQPPGRRMFCKKSRTRDILYIYI